MHFKQNLPDLPPNYANPINEFAVDPSLAIPGVTLGEDGKVPRMSIVIMIVGSRGSFPPLLTLLYNN